MVILFICVLFVAKGGLPDTKYDVLVVLDVHVVFLIVNKC
jgi:hypothetical protein